jgi:hypothetical protein
VEGEIGPGTGAVEEEFDHVALPWFVVAPLARLPLLNPVSNPVIASEAKQSMSPHKEWIASSLRSSQ